MLLLLLLSYAFKAYVAAHPLPHSQQASLFGPQIPRDVAPSKTELGYPETRSVWDIAWGCLITIFACTWLSIHPNIPDKDEGCFMSILRRIKLMVYAFLVPEVVIMWAIRQRIAASNLVSEFAIKYKDKVPEDRNEWTVKHGFFLQMGGFVLYENGKPKYTILPKKFGLLMDENRIDFPRVHEKDLTDRSKGDFFSKGVVLIQTAWFVVQCIARWVQELGLTELEVLTLALAVLNGVIYALWLHKPLNVQWHIRVDLKAIEEDTRHITNDEIRLVSKSKNIMAEPGTERGAEGFPKPLLVHKCAGVEGTTSKYRLFDRLQNQLGDVFSGISSSTFVKNYRRRVNDHGLFLCVVRYLTLYPFAAMILPIYDMTGNDDVEDEPKYSPMFYADGGFDDAHSAIAIIGGVIVGSIFGAFHCIAWNFQFPSQTEYLLWRISAITVTAAPVAIVAVGLVLSVVEEVPDKFKGIKESLEILGVFIAILSPILYIIARMILLILALISLRAIPTNCLAQIDWVSFLHHI